MFAHVAHDERLDDALARRARIYAEIVGHASSSDAYHVAAPDPKAAGAIRAMRWELEDADVLLDQVSYINAHGTSTPVNDAITDLHLRVEHGELPWDMSNFERAARTIDRMRR